MSAKPRANQATYTSGSRYSSQPNPLISSDDDRHHSPGARSITAGMLLK
jgi:hypothetical protein